MVYAPLLETRGVVVERVQAPQLRLPDITLAMREQVVLLGPSGSGKTTLLSVLAGLLPPTRGVVTFERDDLYKMPPSARDALRGRRFGFVFQTLHLLPSLSLRDNIALAGDMAGAADQGRIDALLSTLGLTEKAHRKPEALSQGEQQRAAIARAVLNRPSVIIADEPTSALDDANAAVVADLLQIQARESGAALLVATHDNRIAGRFDRVVRLDTVMEAA